MTTLSTIKLLRAQAISHSLRQPTTLQEAIDQLKFIQADPIRSPARAQDLILRQRVKNYQAGDLEREYPALDLEEDILYAYGFVNHDLWRLLHPRKIDNLSDFEQKILETVRNAGETHPRSLEEAFGRERVINAWGGYSKQTTRTLEKLHYRGWLRVARRADGIRIYEAVPSLADAAGEPLTLNERLRKLILVSANILAPVTERCLPEALAMLRRAFPTINFRALIAEMIKSGELERQTIDGVNYLLPSGDSLVQDELPRRLRLLAPFDPLIWDRRRFEHLWGWAYRFEAYTPAAKRIRGYYALPMLWIDNIIGWANVKIQNGELHVETGFIDKQPTGKAFANELEKEIERLKFFLHLK